MENQIEQIKQKIDIVDFIGAYITLKKSGRNYKANCPFHQEKSPSFVVSPDRQIWHCFGSCGDGGDIIKFLMKWENITFIEALRELAQKVGITLNNVNVEDKEWSKKELLLKINLLAADFFHYILQKTPYGAHAREYVETRKINSKIIETFQLGYAPQSWDSLLKFLKKKGYSEQNIIDAGLAIRNDNNRVYDRFRNRLIFVLKDPRGNIVGFSGRALNPEEKNAKYINSPETFVYHKRETLFGIHITKDAIKKENNVYIVEGEFDMITPFQHGIENIVAIKGSALTREQLTLLKRYTNKITLMLDADNAGEEAVKRAIDVAEPMEFEVSIVEVQGGKDPHEAVLTDEVSFKKALKNPVPIYDFILDINKGRYSLVDPYSKKEFADAVIGYIYKIRNPIVQSYYIKKVSQLTDVSEKSVESLLRKYGFNQKQRITIAQPKFIEQEAREVFIQKYLLSLLFQRDDIKSLITAITTILDTKEFTIPAYGKILQLLYNFMAERETFDFMEFSSILSPELLSVANEIYLYASMEVPEIGTNIEKIAYEIKRHALKRRISSLLSAFESLDSDKKSELSQLSVQLNQVEKKVSAL